MTYRCFRSALKTTLRTLIKFTTAKADMTFTVIDYYQMPCLPHCPLLLLFHTLLDAFD